MNFDLKKIAPWNWFKSEQQEAQQSVGSQPVSQVTSPICRPLNRFFNCTARLIDCSTRLSEVSASDSHA